jgi:hypothetical protein
MVISWLVYVRVLRDYTSVYFAVLRDTKLNLLLHIYNFVYIFMKRDIRTFRIRWTFLIKSFILYSQLNLELAGFIWSF